MPNAKPLKSVEESLSDFEPMDEEIGFGEVTISDLSAKDAQDAEIVMIIDNNKVKSSRVILTRILSWSS